LFNDKVSVTSDGGIREIMGQYFPESDQYPLEEQVKTLADDELLDFWEEAQLLDRPFSEENTPAPTTPLEYERIILQELMLRSCMRGAGTDGLR
jgi:hypothetical protein